MILKPLSRIIANYRIRKSNSLISEIKELSGIDFEDIESILMISPMSGSEIEDAKSSINIIKTQIKDVDVTLFDTTALTEKNKNLFGYPKSEYLLPFKNRKFDIILDLSRKFSLMNTYIISCMQPAIRIKDYHDDRNDQSYNFIFTNQKKTHVDRTRHMISMLHHVMSKKIIS